MEPTASLLLLNGRVYTGDPAQPWVSAMAIRDGIIRYAGDASGAWQALAGIHIDQVVDLKGATVVPGMTDAHIHFSWFSIGLAQVNGEKPTKAEVLSQVQRFAESFPSNRWIQGYGWNHNVWGGDFPTAADLDSVAPNHPVILNAKSGHAAWVNSTALRLAGIDANTPNPPGGQILRGDGGQPTGILLENAIQLVSRLVPDPTLPEMIEAVKAGMQVAHRAGLTGIHCMDEPLAFQAYQALQENGELTLRVTKSIPFDHLNEAIGLGLHSGFGNDWLRVGSVKMFADGALGPRTAWMLEGYDSAPLDTGISTTPIEVICQAVRRANAAGLSTAIHAIGDRAIREVLDVYTEVQTALGKCLRNRIEHVQLVHPDDAGRLAQLGIIASMQPLHATSDMDISDQHWGKRSRDAYALKTQVRAGAALALGSDCPVEILDPLAGIHAAVTRRRADGTPGPEGWYPEQRLTVAEAVRGYTWGPAYATGMEDRLGALTAGKLADMVILNRNIFTIDPMEILQTEVLATITGGRFVWRSDELS